MALSDRYLEELTERNDIVDVIGQYVRLDKKVGRNYVGLCPFHSEKTPSFNVSPERQSYHCFGCGKGGGVIGFVMEQENLGFRDAVEMLAERAKMPAPDWGDDPRRIEEESRRKKILELNRAAAKFFYETLIGEQGRAGQSYVLRRGISMTMVKNFGLGYAPDSWDSLIKAMRAKGYDDRDLLEAGLAKPGRNGGAYDTFRNRLMFPVIDVRGSVIGFSGRILGDGEPKYLNSPETPVFSKSRNLFALNLAKKTKSGYIILTEGNIDVVSLHQAGFDSAVASLGTSLTEEQAKLISRFVPEVVLCYDGDNAGKKASQRAISIFQKLDLKVRVLSIPEGAKDPDEYIQKFGADAFRNLIESSEGDVEYRLRELERQYPTDTDAGKIDFLKNAENLLAALPSAVQREIYAARVAEKLGVSREAVAAEAERIRKARIKAAGKRESREFTQPEKNAQPRQKEFRYENPRSARAEEGIVRLLFADPAIVRGRDMPEAESFSSPVLAKFYRELLHRARTGESISVAVLSARFTPEEMNHFTAVLSNEEDLSNADRALGDYIHVITEREEEEDDLLAFRDKQKKTKAYGG